MSDLNAELAQAERLNEARQQPSSEVEKKYNEGAEKSKDIQKPSSAADAINTAKNLSKATTPMGVFSVLKKIDFLNDMPYFSAIGAAMLKDLLDIINEVTIILWILNVLFSILCSIFIFMMLMLAGSNGKRKNARGLIKKGLTIAGGGVLDSLPAVDMLPVETATVITVYLMVLFER